MPYMDSYEKPNEKRSQQFDSGSMKRGLESNSEDIARQELEEGKTGMSGGGVLLVRSSPNNLQKRRAKLSSTSLYTAGGNPFTSANKIDKKGPSSESE